MSDDAPKPLDTVRPPEGDDDLYSASTKVGEASPEILELVRQAEADALKPARVPSGADLGGVAATSPTTSSDDAAKSDAQTAPPPAEAGEAAAAEAERAVESAAAEPAVSSRLPTPTVEGIPPLSMLVLVVAVVVAGWLGYQALHAPAPSTTPPGVVAP